MNGSIREIALDRLAAGGVSAAITDDRSPLVQPAEIAGDTAEEADPNLQPTRPDGQRTALPRSASVPVGLGNEARSHRTPRHNPTADAGPARVIDREARSGGANKVPPLLARRGLIATDIVDYGQLTALDQDEAQRIYANAMHHAATQAGLSIGRWRRQAAGDGEFVVLPGGVHEPRILATMLPVLAAQLREHNRPRLPKHQIRLRVAMHHGVIHLNGATGYPGPPAVVVARLLAATALRDLMRTRRDVSLAVIVSAELYHEVVINRYQGLRPELFQRVQAEVPARSFTATAWLYAPGHEITRCRNGSDALSGQPA